MTKLKNNHRHQRSCEGIHQAQRNLASLLGSSNLKRWIIILFLFYKLDYKDYYCYGISSGSAILNNENGKDLRLVPFLAVLIKLSVLILYPSLLKVNLLSPTEFPSSFSQAGALCFLLFVFFLSFLTIQTLIQ